jgi:hypothetical protein
VKEDFSRTIRTHPLAVNLTLQLTLCTQHYSLTGINNR